jgi:hypothetical protein
MSYLADDTRMDSAAKLRQAADLLERGDEKEAGKLILDGLAPVARDLKRTYGPMVKLMVGSWVRRVLE